MKKDAKYRKDLRQLIISPIDQYLESNELFKGDLYDMLVELWGETGRESRLTLNSFYKLFKGGKESNRDDWSHPPFGLILDIYKVSLKSAHPLDVMSIFTGYDTPDDSRRLGEMVEKYTGLTDTNKELKQRIVLANYHLEKGNFETARAVLSGNTAAARG